MIKEASPISLWWKRKSQKIINPIEGSKKKGRITSKTNSKMILIMLISTLNENALNAPAKKQIRQIR